MRENWCGPCGHAITNIGTQGCSICIAIRRGETYPDHVPVARAEPVTESTVQRSSLSDKPKARRVRNPNQQTSFL